MSKIKNYMMEIHDFLDRHYKSYHDLDKVITLLQEEFDLDTSSAIAHIRRFDEEMQTIQIEP